jgi:hypothetical protein
MLKGEEQRFDELVAKDDLHVGHYSASRVQRWLSLGEAVVG